VEEIVRSEFGLFGAELFHGLAAKSSSANHNAV
jgi:hypothetical protein